MLARLLTESLHKQSVDGSIDPAPVTCPDVVEGMGKLGDMTNGIPGRPKGMHRKTYYRLLRDAQYHNQKIGLMVDAWRDRF